MKISILLIAILFSTFTISARDGAKKLAQSTERISTDRFFYVTYRYTDLCGMEKVGSFVWASRHAYPQQSDLRLRAADLTCSDHQLIKITGIDAICQTDYNALAK